MKSNSKSSMNPYSNINSDNNKVEFNFQQALPSPVIPEQNQLFGQPLISLAQQQEAVHSDGNKVSERERRLKLREIERQKRVNGIVDSTYGKVENMPKTSNEEINKENYSSNNKPSYMPEEEQFVPKPVNIYGNQMEANFNSMNIAPKMEPQIFTNNNIQAEPQDKGAPIAGNESNNYYQKQINTERDKKERQKQEMWEDYQKMLRDNEKGRKTESAQQQRPPSNDPPTEVISNADIERKKKELYAQELKQQIQAKKPPIAPKYEAPITQEKQVESSRIDDEKRKKDDYRRALMEQIQEKEKNSKVAISQEQKSNMLIKASSEVLESRPQSNGSYGKYKGDDDLKKADELKKLKLAEELKKQMEDKKKQKETEKLREKQEQEREEERLKKQRAEMEKSNTKKPAKKKYQNEASADNPFIGNARNVAPAEEPQPAYIEPPQNENKLIFTPNQPEPAKEIFEAHEIHEPQVQHEMPQNNVQMPPKVMQPMQEGYNDTRMNYYPQMPNTPQYVMPIPMQMPPMQMNQYGISQMMQEFNLEKQKIMMEYQKQLEEMKEFKYHAKEEALEAKEQLLKQKEIALNMKLSQITQSMQPQTPIMEPMPKKAELKEEHKQSIKTWKEVQLESPDKTLETNTNLKLIDNGSPNIEESLQASTKLVTIKNSDADKFYETFTGNEMQSIKLDSTKKSNQINLNQYSQAPVKEMLPEESKTTIDPIEEEPVPVTIKEAKEIITDNKNNDVLKTDNSKDNTSKNERPITSGKDKGIMNMDALLQDSISGSKFTSINLNHNNEDEVKDDVEETVFHCEEVSMNMPKYETTDNNVNIGELSVKKEEVKKLPPLAEEEEKYENDFELVEESADVSTGQHQVIQNIKTMMEEGQDNKEIKPLEVKEEINVEESHMNTLKEKKASEILKIINEEFPKRDDMEIPFEEKQPISELLISPSVEKVSESKNMLRGIPKVRDPFKKSDQKKKDAIKFTNLSDARKNRFKQSGNMVFI